MIPVFCRINPKFEQYDEILCSILNNYTCTPLKKRVVTIRPTAPWYNQEVALGKNERRHLKRRWRITKLKCDLERFVLLCSSVNNLTSYMKITFNIEFIKEHSGNQKVLFSTVNKLLQKEVKKRYPPLAILLPTSLQGRLTLYILRLTKNW